MKASPANIDTSKLYARYAEIKNASQVAREFGISRFQVGKIWDNLPEKEQQQYEQQVVDKRAACIEQYVEANKNQTINYIEKLEAVKATLIAKLEVCVAQLDPTDATNIARIKDASTALKNLCTLSQEVEQPENDIFQTFTKLQQINDKQS